ncbi:MAG: hypothetical protein ABJJ37_19900, partial [Roseibium sp.]
MGLSNIVKRLNKYQDRVAEGKAEKIKSRHIQKAIEKLAAKEIELTAELQDVTKLEKRKRLNQKISTIHEQIEKAK